MTVRELAEVCDEDCLVITYYDVNMNMDRTIENDELHRYLNSMSASRTEVNKLVPSSGKIIATVKYSA